MSAEVVRFFPMHTREHAIQSLNWLQYSHINKTLDDVAIDKAVSRILARYSDLRSYALWWTSPKK